MSAATSFAVPAPGGARSSLDRVAAAIEQAGLKIRGRRRDGFMASCPVHDDSDPSMNVSWRPGERGGLTLLHCHGCQAPAADLAEALGLSLPELFDEPLPPRTEGLSRGTTRSNQIRREGRKRGRRGHLPKLLARSTPAKTDDQHVHDWQEVTRYRYVDVQGHVVQDVIRYECRPEDGSHSPDKDFKQRYFLHGAWHPSQPKKDFTPVLYRAPEVRAAVTSGVTVWLLEGEKDVHTAESLGVVATTNAMGGGAFPDVLVEELRGADVVLVLDRDGTGYARGVDLHARLIAVGARVRLRLPLTEDRGSDLTDHVHADHGLDELVDVDVLEVATWAAHAKATRSARRLEQALEQADARQRLADDDHDVEANLRYVRAWVLETEVRLEALREEVDEVQHQGLRVGTVWVGEAMLAADEMLKTATEHVHRAHDIAGMPVPDHLRTTEAPLDETSDDAATAAVPVATSTTPAPSAPHAGPTAAIEALAADGGRTTRGRLSELEGGRGATAPVFRALNGQIVEWQPPKNRRSEDEEEGTFKVVLSMVVKVTAREYLEDEETTDPDQVQLQGRATASRRPTRAPRQLVAVRLAYADTLTEQAVEIRVVADSWRDHSWLDSLPGPVDYDHRRAGLDNVQRAILAISSTAVDEVLPRSTGWYPTPEGGHQYVHARGAITAAGHQDLPVHFGGTLRHYDLPDPTQDATRLRAAFWQHSGVMLTAFPRRVAAPLLGQVFRSAIGQTPWVVALIGPKGSFKTSVAAKAMNHWGEAWQDGRPGTSMSGNGDTLNAIRKKLHEAKDTLYWLDDFAPTKSWQAAQTLLEETARLIHNREERSRSSRDGQSLAPGTPPRASGLTTSEVMPRPASSGGERMLVLPLAPGDIDRKVLFGFDDPHSRYSRALLQASFICWLAGDLTAHRARYLAIADEYAALLTDEGESIRQGQALAHTWAGWVAMADFLQDRGAISADERTKLLGDVDEGLREAGRTASDPDLPRTTGERVLELLRFALQQGLAHVNDVRNGDCPPWPLASRLGWRQQVLDLDIVNPKVRRERMGDSLGYVLHDPEARDRGRVLICSSSQLEAVIKAATAKQTEKLELDRNTAVRALAEVGALIQDTSEGRTRFTVKTRLHHEKRTARMVVLHLDRVLDDGGKYDDDDGDDGDDGGGGGGRPPAGPARDGGGTTEDATASPVPAFPVAGSPELPSETSLEPLPGMDGPTPDPQDLDAPPATVQADEHAPDQGDDGPDRPQEEDPTVRPLPFTPRPWTDADGVVGWSEPKTSPETDCRVCGRPCGVQIAGVVIHLPCWELSTAASRARGATPVPPASQPQEQAPQQPARPSRRPAATSPATGATTLTAAAAVVDVDGVWCSDGSHLPLPEPLAHLGDLVRLAQRLRLGTQKTAYLADSGQVWVGDGLAARLGVDLEAIRAAPVSKRQDVARSTTAQAPGVTEALADGFQLGAGAQGLGRWTRVWQGSDKPVWVVLLAAEDHGPGAIPLLAGEPDHAALARRIGLLASHLQAPYALSASTTGLDLMTALRWKDRDRLFSVREAHGPARIPTIESDLNWTRRPTAEEAAHQWVHAYDRSGSYLAGVSGLDLGVGDPVHHPQGRPFEKVPGYWRIEVPDAGDVRVPNPLDPNGSHAGRTRWVTTPTLQLGLEQDYDPTVVEAWTWSDKARVLDPWYDRIRDARSALDQPDVDAQAARDQLKMIYATTIGMLGSELHMKGRTGYAPDWRHHVIAKARANILRRVDKIGRATGRWPVAILADTVVYTSDEADPVAAWPGEVTWLGRDLGRYKVEGSAPMADQLQYLTGGTYKGKDALTGDA